MSSSPSVSLSWCEGCSSAWWQTGKAVCYLSCWHSKWCCLIRLSLGFTEVRTEAGEEQIYGRLHQQRVWRRGFIESDLGFCPAALTPVCHKQAKPHGSKPGDGLLVGVWLNPEPAQELELSPWGALSWDWTPTRQEVSFMSVGWKWHGMD